MNNLVSKIKNIVQNFFKYWSKPAEGKFVSNKELVAYSAGGMGVQFIITMSYQVAMTANCYLIGSIYGLKPSVLALLAGIATAVSLVLQPLKAWLIDNTNTKQGKARPYVLWLGLPTAILTCAAAFIPLSTNKTVIAVIIGVLYCLLFFSQTFYLGMYTQLAQLMTPNSDERSVILSVSSIAYSMAPTITGFVIPLVADAFKSASGMSGLLNQKLYQVILPVFCIIGLGLSVLAYFGTKERIVVPKRYKAKVKFWPAMWRVCKNKYFWITNTASWFVFARGAVTAIMAWAYVYVLQNDNVMSAVTLILGTASLIGMAIAPIMMKTIGKKWTTISTTLVLGVASLLLMFTADNFAVTAVLFYIIFAATAVQMISAPAINADILDYHQWKTGERVEGISGNLSMIGSLLGIGTGFVVPAIYEIFGLIDNYDVLYDPAVRKPMYTCLAIVSLVGAALNALPFIFYDLTNKKHKQIIEELKQRALEQNKEDGIEETEEELIAELQGVNLAVEGATVSNAFNGDVAINTAEPAIEEIANIKAEEEISGANITPNETPADKEDK